MLDWTDRYCRYFLRLISRHTLLYTEMVTTGAIIHGDKNRFLDFHPSEHPIALQLGGSDPKELATCASHGKDWGYDEINLNVGCPSDRVQSGRFGACLMADPILLAESFDAMQKAVEIPITVKHRLGIDELDSDEHLHHFVETLADAGCKTFIVHARKAWLQGLSPKQNRDVPPLQYERVFNLKRSFPELEIILNGGILTLSDAAEKLDQVDGVMIGRAAYHDPWIISQADNVIFNDPHPIPTRHEVARAMLSFIEDECTKGTPLKRMTRHILGLFQGQPGAKAWRRTLSEKSHLKNAGPEVVEEALARVPEN